MYLQVYSSVIAQYYKTIATTHLSPFVTKGHITRSEQGYNAPFKGRFLCCSQSHYASSHSYLIFLSVKHMPRALSFSTSLFSGIFLYHPTEWTSVHFLLFINYFFLQSVRITYKYVKMTDEKVVIFNLLLEVVIELTQLAPYIYIRITDLFYLIYIFFPIFRKNIWLHAKKNWESTFIASHLPGYSPPSFVRVSNVRWVCSFSEFYFSFI